MIDLHHREQVQWDGIGAHENRPMPASVAGLGAITIDVDEEHMPPQLEFTSCDHDSACRESQDASSASMARSAGSRWLQWRLVLHPSRRFQCWRTSGLELILILGEIRMTLTPLGCSDLTEPGVVGASHRAKTANMDTQYGFVTLISSLKSEPEAGVAFSLQGRSATSLNLRSESADLGFFTAFGVSLRRHGGC